MLVSPVLGLRARLDSLTGLRALAALLVVGTHAAFATGKLTHGYIGLVWARLEVGVSIFFALSGFLLFRPWVVAAADETAAPSARTYARRRLRRVMPAYVVTVLLAYGVYSFYSTGPNPGQSISGLIRHLTLTQIYTDNYLLTYLHRGLSQTWSLAVEAAFYALLPLLAHLLLVLLCGDRWRPARLLTGLAGLAAISPVWLIVLNTTDWLPNSAGMWLPAQLAAFAGGMAVAVLHVMGVRLRAGLLVPAAVVLFLVVSTPLAGAVTMGPVPLWEPLTKALLYAAIAMLVVAAPTLGGRGLFDRVLASKPMVWLGAISYEIFLLHVLVMAVVLSAVGWPLFTGSLPGLYVLTLGVTIPLAWLLHRLTSARERPCPGTFEGKTAVVTGASRGIGLAVAQRLVEGGARVVITARTQQTLDEAVGTLGGPAYAVGLAGSADDSTHQAAVVDCAVDAFGSLDLLVNNTGSNYCHGPLVDTDLADARKTVDVNCIAALSWVQHAHRAWMGEHGGAVVNVSSVAGVRPAPDIGFYGATKVMLTYLTQQLAAELGPAVRVNAVAPATVKTQFATSLYEGREEEVAVTYPLKRLGMPDDIGAAVAFLLSDDASWITGQLLVVDGGITLLGADWPA